jgi:DNA-directed RNA polymerase I subunit RPA1
MTASASIKTPMMRLPLKEGTSTTSGEALAKSLSRLVLSQIMESVSVQEELGSKNAARTKVMTVTLRFWPQEVYKAEHGVSRAEVLQVIEKKFIPAFERAVARDIKQRTRKSADTVDEEAIGVGMAQTERRKPQAAADAGADSDPEDASSEVGDDGDATAAKTSRNRTQHASYDEPDEDDEEVIANVNSELMDIDEEDDETPEEETTPIKLSEQERQKQNKIMASCNYISGYDFDHKNGTWCRFKMSFPVDCKKILMVALVEQVCSQVTLHEIKGISRCYPMLNESESDTSFNLGTDGVNFHDIWTFADQIDLSNIYTNDIAAVLRNYGVEAARAAVMQEIASVFGVYGINVDPRHLSLIADYMVCLSLRVAAIG